MDDRGDLVILTSTTSGREHMKLRRTVGVGAILMALGACGSTASPSGQTAPSVQEALYADTIGERDPFNPQATPCNYEDGSADAKHPQVYPCFWDARTEGNGVGLSFWVTQPNAAKPYDLCYEYLNKKADKKYGGCE